MCFQSQRRGAVHQTGFEGTQDCQGTTLGSWDALTAIPYQMKWFLNHPNDAPWGADLATVSRLAESHGVSHKDVRAIAAQIAASARVWAALARAATPDGGPGQGNPGFAQPPRETQVRARTAAMNWLALGLAVAPGETLTRLRMDGVLRASTYEWAVAVPRELVRVLREHAAQGVFQAPGGFTQGGAASGLTSTPTTNAPDVAESSQQYRQATALTRYFDSVAALHTLASALRKTQDFLVADICRDGAPGALGMLATIDLLFARVGMPKAWAAMMPSEAIQNPEDPASLAPVKLADAATYALALHQRYAGRLADLPGVPITDAAGAAAGRYLGRLARMQEFNKMREWEELVDVHDYLATTIARLRIRIAAPTAEYEKAIRLAFINAAQQQAVAAKKVPSTVWDIDRFVRAFVESFPDLFSVTFASQPLPRFRMEISGHPVVLAQLAQPELFAEEAALVESLFPEHLIDAPGLHEFVVRDGVTLWHLLVVQRLFRLMNARLHATLEKQVQIAPEVAIRSILPIFRRNTLVDLIGALIGSEYAASTLALLEADPSSPRYDLHYSPLLRLREDHYVVPTHVLGDAHLVRNIWQATSTRVHPGAVPDPAELMLRNAIRKSGGHASTGIKYSHNGERGELDVLGVVDEVFLVIEFKRALFPSSVRELRGSRDPMKKGAAQLSRIANAWPDAGFRKALSGKLKSPDWSDADRALLIRGAPLYTVVALSNRMFSGWREDGHPVRGVLELGGFLASGIVGIATLAIEHGLPTRVASAGSDMSLWNGDSLTAEDLHRYLTDDALHRTLFDAMVPADLSVDIGRIRVDQESFALNVVTFIESMHARFREVPTQSGEISPH